MVKGKILDTHFGFILRKKREKVRRNIGLSVVTEIGDNVYVYVSNGIINLRIIVVKKIKYTLHLTFLKCKRQTCDCQ